MQPISRYSNIGHPFVNLNNQPKRLMPYFFIYKQFAENCLAVLCFSSESRKKIKVLVIISINLIKNVRTLENSFGLSCGFGVVDLV
jgi:hypothetical protein